MVDVEGGKATLVVSPSNESLLIDTGNVGEGAQRDADRIMAAIKSAGLSHIDHLMTTHWHRDHFGAMPLVAARIPIREFIDHGMNVQPDVQADTFLQQTYPGLYRRATRTVVKSGDRISIAGVDVRVVASAGETLTTSLPGGGTPNPYCAGFKHQNVDKAENARSIGILITFGKFRVLDLGDLSANKEFDLMCPNNLIGTVDLFMVSHHGQPNSNSTVLVHAIESRVAIMNNGTRKGGQPEVMKVIHSAPGLEDLWQLHFSQLSGQAVHGARIVHRQPRGHAAAVDACRSNATATPRRAPSSAAGSQWHRVLDQGIGATERLLRCHEWPKRILEDLQSADQLGQQLGWLCERLQRQFSP